MVLKSSKFQVGHTYRNTQAFYRDDLEPVTITVVARDQFGVYIVVNGASYEAPDVIRYEVVLPMDELNGTYEHLVTFDYHKFYSDFQVSQNPVESV